MYLHECRYFYFFFNATATTEIYSYLHTLSLHDALPISMRSSVRALASATSMCHHCTRVSSSSFLIQAATRTMPPWARSEEHTSELQSLMRISYAVFCLKKKKNIS